MSETMGLRERTRVMVRSVITDEAVNLFTAQGYEQTTIDQIAAAAGLSRRSFFRYFAGKDDVLTQAMDAVGDQLAAALAARPCGERPWLALRRCFDGLLADMAADERTLQLTRILLQAPTMHAVQLQKHSVWRRRLAAVLRERQPAGLTVDVEIWADTLCGAALSCLITAQMSWTTSEGGARMEQLLDQSMQCLYPAGDG